MATETEEQLQQSILEYKSKTDPWGYWVYPLVEDLYIEGELRQLAEKIWAERMPDANRSLPMALAFTDMLGYTARQCVGDAKFVMRMAREMGWINGRDHDQ